jgi:hypothetical protein
MDFLTESEKAYYTKVDTRNGVNNSYTIKTKEDHVWRSVNQPRQDDDDFRYMDGVANRALIMADGQYARDVSSSTSLSSSKSTMRKFTSADFATKMNSQLQGEKAFLVGKQLTDQFALRLPGVTEKSAAISTMIDSTTGHSSYIPALHAHPSQETNKPFAVGGPKFRGGGFSRNPFVGDSSTINTSHKNKPVVGAKRKFDDGKPPGASIDRSIDIDKKLRGDKVVQKHGLVNMANTHVIYGVCFCDCKCTGCIKHPKSNSSTTHTIDCYYRSKDSKIEYVIHDPLWKTTSIDHVQVMEPLLDGLQSIENIDEVSTTRISIENLLELLDASNIIPFTFAVFCTSGMCGKNTQNEQRGCYTTLQESGRSLNVAPGRNGETSEIEYRQMSHRSKLQNSKENVQHNLNQRICLNSSHTHNCDLSERPHSFAKKPKGDELTKYICAIIESKSTCDERFIIRTCLICTNPEGKSIAVTESRIQQNAQIVFTSSQQKQTDGATFLSSSSSLSNGPSHHYSDDYTDRNQTIFSKILGDSPGNVTKESMTDIFLRLILEFNNTNNPDVIKTASPDLDCPSFFSIDKMERSEAVTGSLWRAIKHREIWTYSRSFIILSPSI